MAEEKDVKLLTGKSFTSEEGVQFIAVSRQDLFGRPDIVLVSKDGKTWIAHDPDELSKAMKNGEPIKVG